MLTIRDCFEHRKGILARRHMLRAAAIEYPIGFCSCRCRHHEYLFTDLPDDPHLARCFPHVASYSRHCLDIILVLPPLWPFSFICLLLPAICLLMARFATSVTLSGKFFVIHLVSDSSSGFSFSLFPVFAEKCAISGDIAFSAQFGLLCEEQRYELLPCLVGG